MITRTHIFAIVAILALGGLYMYSSAQRGSKVLAPVPEAPEELVQQVPVESIGLDSTTATTSTTISTTPAKTATSSSTITQKIMKPTAPVRPATLLPNGTHTVTIETTLGTIVIETYDTDAPLASSNFVALAQLGFYDNVIFHRVIPGFMIQGGDPTGTGRGGPEYRFADELTPTTDSYKNGYKRGTVAMANAGPNTNGSQFFIMHADYPLDHNYTIFGKILSGLDVVDAIAATPTNYEDRPDTPVVMKKVSVKTRNQ